MKLQDKIILDHHTLANLAYQFKVGGYVVGTTNGCFDILHPGHAKFLEVAGSYVDVLIVLINDDDYIVNHKGRSPIYPQLDRCRIVAAHQSVTLVTIMHEDEPSRLIELIIPNIHINAATYGRDCIEANAVRRCGAELVLVGNLGPYSTTDIITRIKEI